MDPVVHKRYLDYRERHQYFALGGKLPMLSGAEFATYDAELRALAAKGETRDDEEEARHDELLKLLLQD